MFEREIVKKGLVADGRCKTIQESNEVRLWNTCLAYSAFHPKSGAWFSSIEFTIQRPLSMPRSKPSSIGQSGINARMWCCRKYVTWHGMDAECLALGAMCPYYSPLNQPTTVSTRPSRTGRVMCLSCESWVVGEHTPCGFLSYRRWKVAVATIVCNHLAKLLQKIIAS